MAPRWNARRPKIETPGIWAAEPRGCDRQPKQRRRIVPAAKRSSAGTNPRDRVRGNAISAAPALTIRFRLPKQAQASPSRTHGRR
jgi:hypothetical protein